MGEDHLVAVAPNGDVSVVRFGVFELDPRAGELRKRGARLALQEQPLALLLALLERPGEVVTRAELRQRLWPSGTFVDFDHSLATSINKIRSVLGDSATSPRFVETVARRGYRFIGGVQAAAPEATSPAPHEAVIDSLAVLPFENAGDDTAAEYLSDGLTDSIIMSLSPLRTVRVMARTTVFRYKGRSDPLAVGRELQVRAVLVGQVVQRAGRLRITVELVDVANGWQLWGAQYECEPADLSTVEGAVATDVCRALRVKLSRAQQTRLELRRSGDPAAHWSYLKGRYEATKMTADGLERGIAHFRDAVRLDPGHASAHAALAAAYNLLGFFGISPPAEIFHQARRAALAALALDDGLAGAHAVMASVLKVCDWNWAGAEREYRRALEINPSDANAHHWYADFLSALGRSDEALHQIHLAQENDPLSLRINVELAWNSYIARDYARSIEYARRTLDMEAACSAAHLTLGLAFEQSGRFAEAVTACRSAYRRSGRNPAAAAALGHALASGGERNEALALLGELRARAERGYVSPYCVALLHAGLDDAASALGCLRRALEAHDFWLVWVARDPRLDGLRGDPGFEDILVRIGLRACEPPPGDGGENVGADIRVAADAAAEPPPHSVAHVVHQLELGDDGPHQQHRDRAGCVDAQRLTDPAQAAQRRIRSAHHP
jgi:TolB-like protein/tetratricopeptide (TPR) repeat protein